MKTTHLIALGILLAGITALGTHGSAQSSDREAVRRAAMDYLEGFYEGDTTKLVRAVAPTVYKYGYSRRDEGYTGSQMTFAGFMAYANSIKSGRNKTPANAPKEVQIFEVSDQIANVKVTAWWGFDYLLMAKQNGKGMITHVIWQSPPRN